MSQQADRYEFRAIREHDNEGNLQRAGFHWHETNYDAMMPALCIATLSGVAIVMLVSMAAGLGRQLDELPQIIAGLVIISAVGLAISLRVFRPLRETILDRNGMIRLPFGMPGDASARRMLAHHNEVVSFEARTRGGVGSVVVMILREGSTTVLSCNLTESEALMIAVQLTTALSEIRASLADGLRAGDTAPPRHEGERELIAPPAHR